MATPASAIRRKSQVFVEIPPSPLHSVKSASAMANRAGPQASTPFNTVETNVDSHPSPSPSSASLKRKSSNASHDMHASNNDPQPPKSKKTKIENPAEKDAAVEKTPKDMNVSDGPATPKSKPQPPDWYLRCHQCARMFDPSVIAHCTFNRPSGSRCTFKYCKACLKNRYQQDIVAVKISPETCSDEVKAKHATGTEYIFQCPRCHGECNCRMCRRAKGLPATGDLHLLARKAAKQSINDVAAPNDGAGPSTPSAKSAPVPKKTGASNDKAKDTKAAQGTAKDVKVKGALAAKGKGSKQVETKVTGKAKAGPSGLVPHVLIPPSPYKTGASVTKKPHVVKKPTPPPKPIPKPLWSLISTPLTFDGAVERMHIREFLLRFAHLTDIARSHLEELEELATSDPCLAAAENVENSDAPQLVGWVSETALRAILIGILTLLSNGASEAGDREGDHDADDRTNDGPELARAIQQIKSSGAHVSKMWAALETLRASSSLVFPDALPPPPDVAQRSTRTTREPPSSVVVSTSQLVPVVAALVETALLTHAVQEDFERAATQERDLARAARELAAAENARFKAEKDAILAKDKRKGVRAEQRAAREAHDAALSAVECAHRLAAKECVPRFGPLGRDAEGRVYFAVTPGVVEREAAVELLEGGKGGVKFGRRKGVVERGEREKMRCWSWFVAVWGKKPEGALTARSNPGEGVRDGEEKKEGEHVEKAAEEGEEGADEHRQGDENIEQWWGFWEPEEVAKLAEWLAMCHGINLESKLAPKDSEDATLLGVEDGQEAVKIQKPRGRPSNASSASSSMRASFNNISDSEDDREGEEDGRDEDEGDEDIDADGDVLMRVDAHGEPLPTKRDLRKLAQGLKEYSEMLAWRIKRASKDNQAKDVEKKADAEDKGKGKAVESPRAQEISPATFYGKK